MNSSVSRAERTILNDLESKTGLRYDRVQLIPSDDHAVASEVLPILRLLPEQIDHEGVRDAIYSLFITKNAVPFLEDILSWWSTERYVVASATLSQALCKLVDSSNCELIWTTWKSLGTKPSLSCWLLADLTAFPSISSEVMDEIVGALNSGKVGPAEFQKLANLKDARIRAWFELQVDSRDSYLRKIAERMLRKTRRSPSGVQAEAFGPTRFTKELYSVETNLSALTSVLSKLKKEHHFSLPRGVSSGNFLDGVEVDTWYRVSVISATGVVLSLWLVLKDIRTVQVFLIEEAQPASA